MSRIPFVRAVMVAGAAMVLCGCAAGRFATADLSAPPEATIKWPMLTLTIPPAEYTSDWWTYVSITREGQDVVIHNRAVGYRQPQNPQFDLDALGFRRSELDRIHVFWKEPDGRLTPVSTRQAG